MNKIKIMICDDIDEIRNDICDYINSTEDMEVIGSVASGAEAIRFVTENEVKPDVILMDIQMEDEIAGITATEQISSAYPNIKILMLTVHENDDLIVDSFLAGAVDFIVKSASKDSLYSTIHNSMSQNEFMGSIMLQALKKNVLVNKKRKQSVLFFINSYSTLTAAEKDVLKLIYQGYSRQKIVDTQHISINTVSTHIRHILKKLNFSSTREITSFIKSIGLFDYFDL